MSYNLYLNNPIGGRGTGKTTQITILLLSICLNKGWNFFFTRRVKDEFKLQRNFLDDYVSGVKVKNIHSVLTEWDLNGRPIAFGCPLSMQHKIKSLSYLFKDTHFLFYDECTNLPGVRYLNNEMNYIFELASTIFREKPVETTKIFLSGNNTDPIAPLNTYFNLPLFKERYVDRDRQLNCELLKPSNTLLEAEKKTGLYMLTKGTAYADYHYGNKTYTIYPMMIIKKPAKDLTLICRLVMENYMLNVYSWNGLRLFFEFKTSVVEDNATIHIVKNNTPAYYEVQSFRVSDVGKFIRSRYAKNLCYCDSSMSVSLAGKVMEIIR